jgi:prevent-host-death family protein
VKGLNLFDFAYAYPYAKEKWRFSMSTLNATEARSKLYALIDETKETHKPILITGKRGNAVLLAEEDWNAISETLYLVSIPGVRESIREGLATDLKDTEQELDW